MSEIVSLLQDHIWWLLLVSIVSFLGTIIIVPMLLVRLPHDYFSHEKRRRYSDRRQHVLIRIVLILVKNSVGALLIIIGLLLLLTPGQGILTILVGLLLMNYPGKYRLERWLISRPTVFRTVNWLRSRADREPLIL